jgi:nitrate reductase delta subunit
MQILTVIARLMDYPCQAVRDHQSDMAIAIGDAREISPAMRTELLNTLQQIYQIPLLDAEEGYCQLFEQGRSLSLLLFEHVHGESRDRGQAMVDLMAVYDSHGFVIDQRELPDYIPLFLEFLAHRPDMEAREWLADVSHILARLGARLLERESAYGHLFSALLMICGKSEVMAEEQRAVNGEERDDTIEAIDREWEEAAVTFSPPDDSDCGSKSTQAPNSNRPQPLNWVDAQAHQPQSINEATGGQRQ